MFIGISLFNLFNLLYHFFMVRNLVPVDYGHLNTLMALFMLITVPANTVQTTITKYVSSFQAQSQYAQVRGFLRHFLFMMAIVAFSFFLLIALGRSFISSFLQISSYGLIILTGIILFFAMVTPVPWGGLQGLQKFGPLAFNLFINGGLKLVLGILFVLWGWGVLGAMAAIAFAYCLTTFISLLLLWFILEEEGMRVHKRENPRAGDSSYISEAYRYFIPVGITLLCFMVLTQIDLILVKHFFTPIEAGYYSIAQMAGKIILFLPLPVVMVMFPKVSLMDAQRKKTSPILMQSLMIAGSFGILGIIICHFFPSHIIQILTGTVYPECIPLIKLFSINMTFFSLTFILLNYHLAVQRKRFIYPLFSLTLIQVGSIVLFHQTMAQVLLVVSIVGVCLLGVNLFLVYFSRQKGMEG
jgi:O-antigen/teichoic acid export membrane protein